MSWVAVGTFLILAIGALKLASPLAMPIVVSVLLSLLFRSPMNWLERRRVPEPLGAGLLVFGSLIAFSVALWFLAAPASEWVERLPKDLDKVEARLRRVAAPLFELRETAERMDQIGVNTGGDAPATVQMADQGMYERLSDGSIAFAVNATSVVFLTFLFLAASSQLKRKLALIVPHRDERRSFEDVMKAIETGMSHYLWLSLIINTLVGVLTWALLALLHFPNAALWGVIAGVLNFAPYVGAVVTALVIAFAGLVSFPNASPALIGAGGFFIINMIETNLLTPLILESRLPINAPAVFVGLLFFGWLWGFTGAVLAVPLTVMVQVICANFPATRAFAILLDAESGAPPGRKRRGRDAPA